MPRRTPRCKFCDRPGLGTPPLCTQHFEESLLAGGSDLDDAVERLRDFAVEYADSVLDRLSQRVFGPLGQPEASPFYRGPGRGFASSTGGRVASAPGGGRRAGNGRRPPPPPPPPPPAPDEMTPQRARDLLHFGADEPLTTDKIKKRRRELARFAHPDTGGAPDAARRLNAAVEVLLERLGRPR